MKHTLLMCFIHGFKGGETTFGENSQFTDDLRGLVAEALPKVNVKVLVYPKFETRGDLGECVSRFRDWLEEKVIDLEVAAETPSPTVDPSVRVILVGHSMGGIVAAETVMGLASDKPIYNEDGIDKSEIPSFTSLMFPRIQAVLAFDTPYLGISPGVVAHGAEGHYQTAQAALTQLGGLGTLWGVASKTATRAGGGVAPAAAPAPVKAASSGGWTWGKMALAAGGAAAMAAGGAAAWKNREYISGGWNWVSSHLEFVNCLARPEALKKRVACMVQLTEELDVGYANLYTRLGKAAEPKTISMVGTVLGKDRTFCVLPNKMSAGVWLPAVNDKATDETLAHMTMFEPKNNPGYNKLAEDATKLIAEWVQGEWYENSKNTVPAIEYHPQQPAA